MSTQPHHLFGAPSATATGPVGTQFPFVLSSSRPPVDLKAHASGSGQSVAGLRVFKTGSFKDSMGYESSWTDYHLDQMAYHFGYLKDMGIFPNVPLRAGHSLSINSVIGYITNIYRDPIDPSFLAVDVDITEPEAYGKWERGTYRARSLEVGTYETNDGAAYSPVVFGLAFVDIPAVEGLYGASADTAKRSYTQVMTDRPYTEDTQMDPVKNPAAPEADSTHGAAPASDPAPATPPPPVSPTPPVVEPAKAEFSAQAPAVQTFSVNGADTSDYARVQAHIAELEEFRAKSITDSRKAAVEGWAAHGKIAQPQVASLIAVSLAMTDTQFEAFASSYDAAPQTALLGRHVDAGGGQPQPRSEDDDFNLLVETLKNHTRSGMKPDEVKATGTYAKFEAACAARDTTPTAHITL